SEIMLVTDVQGQTFTVTRAQEGTSATSHDADAAVFHVLTAGALAQRDIEQFAVGAIADRDAAGQAGRLYLPTEGFLARDSALEWERMPYHRFTPPVIGDFSWVNQGSATVTDRKGMTVLETPSVASGENLRVLVKSAPATPYDITVAMMASGPIYTTSLVTPQFGFCCRESSSGKLLTYGFGFNSYPFRFQYAQMTSPTSLSGGVVDVPAMSHWPLWLRFSDDGTYRRVYVSGDGVKFNLAVGEESRAAFLTADEVGVFANSWKNTYVPRVISFLHWGEA
ncbi:MAG: hypothetical protein JW741_23090, partial [Sedimentisphaerales bacterium]|nr:hypothetical protein [Sedimentisphaerales bacterium]